MSFPVFHFYQNVSRGEALQAKRRFSNSHLNPDSPSMAVIRTGPQRDQVWKPSQSLRQGIRVLDRAVGPKEAIWVLLTIHRFAHQSVRVERSGGLRTTKLNGFSAPVFLDRF